MARKHPVNETTGDGQLLLPVELAKFTGKGAVAHGVFANAQAAYRGIDPGDWSRVYPIMLASWKVYGIPSALDRHREVCARKAGRGAA